MSNKLSCGILPKDLEKRRSINQKITIVHNCIIHVFSFATRWNHIKMKRKMMILLFQRELFFCKSINRSFLLEFIYYIFISLFYLFPYLWTIEWLGLIKLFAKSGKSCYIFSAHLSKIYKLYHVIKGNKMFGLITDQYQS